MSHVTHICDTSRHTYHDTTPHMCDMTPLYVTHIYEGVMSHISMKESCHTYVWRSHVTHIYNTTAHTCDMTPLYAWHAPNYLARAPPFIDDEAPLTYARVMSHMLRSHVTHVKESCHTYEESCHRYAWRDVSQICVTWLLYTYVWHDSFIDMCDI